MFRVSCGIDAGVRMILRLLVLLVVLTGGISSSLGAIHVSTLSFVKDSETLYYLQGGKVHELPISRQGISRPVVVKESILKLYRDKAEVGEEKADFQVRLKDGNERNLLVFYPDRKGTTKLSGIILPIRDFRHGDYFVVNVASNKVRLSLAGVEKEVQPQGMVIFSHRAWRGNVFDISVSLKGLVEGQWRTMYSSLWGHRPTRRSVLFVVKGGTKNRPFNLKIFRDYIAAEELGIEKKKKGK